MRGPWPCVSVGSGLRLIPGQRLRRLMNGSGPAGNTQLTAGGRVRHTVRLDQLA